MKIYKYIYICAYTCVHMRNAKRVSVLEDRRRRHLVIVIVVNARPVPVRKLREDRSREFRK